MTKLRKNAGEPGARLRDESIDRQAGRIEGADAWGSLRHAKARSSHGTSPPVIPQHVIDELEVASDAVISGDEASALRTLRGLHDGMLALAESGFERWAEAREILFREVGRDRFLSFYTCNKAPDADDEIIAHIVRNAGPMTTNERAALYSRLITDQLKMWRLETSGPTARDRAARRKRLNEGDFTIGFWMEILRNYWIRKLAGGVRNNPGYYGGDFAGARAWGPEGETAYEQQTFVREAILSAISEVAAMNRWPVEKLKQVVNDFDPARVVSAYSPSGAALYAAAKEGPVPKWPMTPSPNAVLIEETAIRTDDPELILSVACGILIRNYSAVGSSWWWDVVNFEGSPRVFEMSMGPIPWKWEQRDTMSARNGDLIRLRVPRTDRFGGMSADLTMFGPTAMLHKFARAIADRRNILISCPSTARAQDLAWFTSTIIPTWEKSNVPTVSIAPTDRSWSFPQYGCAAMMDVLVEWSAHAAKKLASYVKTIGGRNGVAPILVATARPDEIKSSHLKTLIKALDFVVIDVPERATREATPVSTADLRAYIFDLPRSVDAEVDAELVDNPPSSARTPAAGRAGAPPRIVAKLKRELTPFGDTTIITCPRDVGTKLSKYLDMANEVFFVLFLNHRNKAVGYFELTSGSIASVEVHPSGIFQAALLAGAAGMITLHNHPSGNPTPSSEDRELWKRLKSAGEIMGIPVIDNMVIGERGLYYSQMESES